MKTSQKGIDLIKRFEGLHDGDKSKQGLQPEMDPVGIWTEGYGRAMKDPTTGDFLRGEHNKHQALAFATIHTLEEAEEALKEDLKPREEAVLRAVKVPLKQGQFDALVSFVYNLGEGNLRRSTLLSLVNQNKFIDAADEFLKWNKGGGKVLAGLTRRRQAERELFLDASVNC